MAPSETNEAQVPAAPQGAAGSLLGSFRNILFLEGPPHKIAMGAAIGTFVAWTPTQGIQMSIAVPICLAVGANPMPAIPIIWLTNPFTAIPVYGFNYWVGWLLVGGPPVSTFVTILTDALRILEHEGARAFLSRLWLDGSDIFVTLWVGSLVVGAVLAVLAYAIVLRGVVAVRRGAAAVKVGVSRVRERVQRRRAERRRKKRKR